MPQNNCPPPRWARDSRDRRQAAFLRCRLNIRRRISGELVGGSSHWPTASPCARKNEKSPPPPSRRLRFCAHCCDMQSPMRSENGLPSASKANSSPPPPQLQLRIQPDPLSGIAPSAARDQSTQAGWPVPSGARSAKPRRMRSGAEAAACGSGWMRSDRCWTRSGPCGTRSGQRGTHSGRHTTSQPSPLYATRASKRTPSTAQPLTSCGTFA
jgi:hypothetical protein